MDRVVAVNRRLQVLAIARMCVISMCTGLCADATAKNLFIRSGDTISFGSIAGTFRRRNLSAPVSGSYMLSTTYKSVIKLLLTRVYASEYPRRTAAGLGVPSAKNPGDIDELDPYVMMYRKLEHYLLARGEHKRLDLVRRCFYFRRQGDQ